MGWPEEAVHPQGIQRQVVLRVKGVGRGEALLSLNMGNANRSVFLYQKQNLGNYTV